MGIYVELKVLPDMIDQKDWEEIYFETLFFLQNCELKLIGLQEETKTINTRTETRIVYSRQLEHDIDQVSERCWKVCGDLDSLKTAESFCFPYLLINNEESHPRRPENAPVNNHDGEIDIVYELIKMHSSDENENRFINFRNILNDKTQGYDYHTAMLAAAMLVENRFPLYAFACGNIDIFQAENARKMVKDTLGKDIRIPACTDKDQLLERISRFKTGLDLLKYFHYIYQNDAFRDSGEVLKYFFEHFPKTIVHEWFLDRMKGFNSASQIGAKGHMIDWLNAECDLKTLIHLLCIDDKGPKFDPLQVAKTLISTWITVPKEKRKICDIFQKPKGATSTVYSQMGEFFFDIKGLQGRNTKAYIDIDTLIFAFNELFTDKSKKIIEEINEEQKQIDGLFDKINAMIDDIDKPLDNNDSDKIYHPELMLRLTENDELDESSTLILKSISALVQKSFNALKKHEQYHKFQNLLENKQYETMLQFLIYWTRENNFIVSENAWAWIDIEKDTGLLSVLLVLLIFDHKEENFYIVKRAIFEKRFLCLKVADMMSEENLDEIETLLEQMLS